MAITYTWTIPTLEHEIADGGVYVAHWRVTGVDGDGNSASSYGTCWQGCVCEYADKLIGR